MNDKFLRVLREYRIVTTLLTVFVMWWGYDTYLFVNTHLSEIKDFALVFYSSIIGLAGWVVKNWMTTSASKSPPEEPEDK
jgi:hypothetical protein